MTPTREQAMVIAATRPDFERYFLESRKSKGANRKPTFERFPDDTYKDDHTQRHWWTWQQSVLAARAQALEDARPLVVLAVEQSILLGEYSKSLDADDPEMAEIISVGKRLDAAVEALKGKQ